MLGKANIFGYVRVIDISNDHTRVCNIYRGSQGMDLGDFLETVKHYLETLKYCLLTSFNTLTVKHYLGVVMGAGRASEFY